jgi:8-oxo-dGTP pyrophosphatase MutT (NUDIX family)
VIRCVSSRLVYENRWLRLREDEIERADGSPGIYSVVEKRDFAVVIPRDDHGLWLVEQERYPVGGRYWELPQGGWDGPARGDAEALARLELEEETGLRAGSLRHLGHLFAAYGFCTQGFDVWLAEDLTRGEPRREASEQDMQLRRVPVAEWERMLRSGEVRDAHSLAAWGLVLLGG